MTSPYAAIVLAGGRAARMGGRPKPELVLGGRRLLDRVLDVVDDAAVRVVVGPPVELPAGVALTREDPAGGGPVAALAAGLAALGTRPPTQVVVVAADLPFLTRDVVRALRTAATVRDGAVLLDADGRDQHLLGAWQVAALHAALAAVSDPHGAPLHRTLAGLDVQRVSWQVPPGTAPPWFDCDSVEQLAEAMKWVGT